MRRYWFLLLIMISCSTKQTINKSNSTSTIKSAFIDVLQQVYLLYDNDQIEKYDKAFNVVARFDNRIEGKVSLIDVYNPQKILLYYEAPQKIQFLDNQLSDMYEFYLDRSTYPDVPIVAMSNNNQIWIWEDVEKQLIKLDDKGNELLKSYRMYDFNLTINEPKRIIEKNNRVFIEDASSIHMFDNFGKYIASYDLPEHFSVSYGDNGFRYIDRENELVTVLFPLMTESRKTINLTQNSPTLDALIDKGDVIQITQDSLYRITY